jgi:hypothetical protein
MLGGELARLAINSSYHEDYWQAATEFRDTLRLWGWPTHVLHAWFSALLQKQWRNKGLEKEPASDYLALKTKYNPIWDGIKIGPIKDTMIKYWGSFTTADQTDSYPIQRHTVVVGMKEVIVSAMRAAQRLISSRMVLTFSRTMSFGNMVNRWNKDLLLVDPSIELADHPEELEVIVSPITSGVGAREFYGK